MLVHPKNGESERYGVHLSNLTTGVLTVLSCHLDSHLLDMNKDFVVHPCQRVGLESISSATKRVILKICRQCVANKKWFGGYLLEYDR